MYTLGLRKGTTVCVLYEIVHICYYFLCSLKLSYPNCYCVIHCLVLHGFVPDPIFTINACCSGVIDPKGGLVVMFSILLLIFSSFRFSLEANLLDN